MEINSLTYPEAVWNRFYSGYDVRIKPEYSERVMVEGQMRGEMILWPLLRTMLPP